MTQLTLLTLHTIKILFLTNQDGRRPMPEHVRGQYTQSASATYRTGTYGAKTANADGVHISAICQIRLNRPCAAAMRPFVKLLSPLVILGLLAIASNFASRLL